VEESDNLVDCKGGCENMRIIVKVKKGNVFIAWKLPKKCFSYIFVEDHTDQEMPLMNEDKTALW
jgi:hypothetical protein